MQINSLRLNNLIKDGVVKEVVQLPKFPEYKKNCYYWCGYWQKYYKVLKYELMEHNGQKRVKNVIIKWEDGKIVNHCTSLNPYRDYILIMNDPNIL